MMAGGGAGGAVDSGGSQGDGLPAMRILKEAVISTTGERRGQIQNLEEYFLRGEIQN